MESKKGEIFDIQGYSVNDGPGCRTLIFLKGCTLRCLWCANPEGQLLYPVPMFDSSQCTLCEECVKVCTEKAIHREDDKIVVARKKCIKCEDRKCAEQCKYSAIKIAGYDTTVKDLLKIIKRDRQYWASDGGITLTGGEPFFQYKFANELLKTCYENYIDTAVETCGNVPWENIEISLQYIDLIFFDIKHIDNNKHIELTGSNNSLILKNAYNLSKYFKGDIIFRYVIVPSLNDSENDLTQLITFLNSLPGENKKLNILPLHHLAREKYRQLDIGYKLNDRVIPSKEELLKIKNKVESFGIECFIGSDTPF